MNPLLTFDFSDGHFRAWPLTDIFHFRDELDVMRDMITCPRYHGDIGNVLTGCHGFNLCPALRVKFHGHFDMNHRQRILHDILPALDHGRKVDEEDDERCLQLITEYRAWRTAEMPFLYKAACTLFRQVFARHNRVYVILNPSTACEEHIFGDEKTFSMYLCMTAHQTKRTRAHEDEDLTHDFTVTASNSKFPENDVSHVLAIVKRFKDFASAHDTVGRPYHFSSECLAWKAALARFFPEYWKAVAVSEHDKTTRRLVRLVFRRYIATEKYVLITPKSQVTVDTTLTRTVTDL